MPAPGSLQNGVAAMSRDRIILVALVICAVVPFAGRAVNMDEPQYLYVARSVIEGHALFPQGVSWTFFGKVYPTMFSQTHLPVAEYYLAAVMKLVGGIDLPTRL